MFLLLLVLTTLWLLTAALVLLLCQTAARADAALDAAQAKESRRGPRHQGGPVGGYGRAV